MSVEMKVRKQGWDKRSSAEVRNKLDRVLEEAEADPSPLTPASVKHKKRKGKKTYYRCRVCTSPLELGGGWLGIRAKGGKCETCGTREVKGSKLCPSCKRDGVLIKTDGTILCGSSLWHSWGCGFRGKPRQAA